MKNKKVKKEYQRRCFFFVNLIVNFKIKIVDNKEAREYTKQR